MKATKKRLMDKCYKEIRRVLAQVPPGIDISLVDMQGKSCHHVFGRIGLLYINPHYTVCLTNETHVNAHKDSKAWREHNHYDKCKDDSDIVYDVHDLKSLLAGYRHCHSVADLKLTYDLWIEIMRGE